MGASPTTGTRTPLSTGPANGSASHGGAERRTTETKSAFKTTEFLAYLGVLAGLLIAGLVVDDEGAGGFGAEEVWRYATFLTIGYMIARGLAKAGSRDPYTHDRDGDRS